MHVVAHLDLSKLARTLQAEARHPELVRAITKAAAAGAPRDDLRDALHSLRLIERILDWSVDAPGASASSGEDTTVTGAFFKQAVILDAGRPRPRAS